MAMRVQSVRAMAWTVVLSRRSKVFVMTTTFVRRMTLVRMDRARPVRRWCVMMAIRVRKTLAIRSAAASRNRWIPAHPPVPIQARNNATRVKQSRAIRMGSVLVETTVCGGLVNRVAHVPMANRNRAAIAVREHAQTRFGACA